MTAWVCGRRPESSSAQRPASSQIRIDANASSTIKLRLTKGAVETRADLADSDFDQVLDRRQQDCDEFYTYAMPAELSAEQKLVFRQAMAGMLWSKQF
jgi:hypothetical protein